MRAGRSIQCLFALFLASAAVRCAADSTIVAWPPQTRAIFAGAQVDGLYVPGPTLANGYAMSDDGVVCTFDPRTSEALIFPKVGSERTTDGMIRAAIGKGPIAVAFKRWKDRAFFLVACNPEHNLYVIDAHEGRLLNTIVTSAAVLNYLAAPANADVPYVYYSGGDGRQGQPGKVGRIDLSSMSDAGLMRMQDNNVLDITVSHDGKMLYARRPFAVPSGFAAMKIIDDSSSLHAKVYHEEPEAHPRIIASPLDDIVASGHTLYSDTLGSKLHDFADWPMAFSSVKPYIFTVGKDSSIAVFTTDRRELVARFPAPFAPTTAPTSRSPAQNEMTSPRLALFVDDVHGNLIALNYAHLAVISLTDLKGQTSFAARVDMTGEASLTAGKAWSATLHRSDPGIAIFLPNPPDGLSLEGDSLRWTPSVAQVGRYPITLALTLKGQHVDEPLTLTVTRGGTALPFIPDEIYLAPDEHHALIAQFHGDHHNRRHDDENIARLALMDLDHGKVIADRTLLAPLRSVGVDDHFVYAGFGNSNAFLALSLTDLSDKQRIFTAGPVWEFQSVGQRLYPAVSGKPAIWYTLPALTSDPNSPPADPLQNSSFPQPITTNLGWYIDGAMFDARASHVHWIEHDTFFQTLNPRRFQIDTSDAKPAGPWDAVVMNSSIRRTNGQEIFQITTPMEGLPIISREQPLVISISRHQVKTADPTTPDIGTQIDLFKLATGERMDPIVLDVSPPRKDNDIRNVPHLSVGMHEIAAQIMDRLYLLPIADLSHDALPVPFTIAPPDGTIVISASQPTTIPMKVTGGKNPMIFGLAEELPGIQLDANSGVLTIDPTSMITRAHELIIRAAQEGYGIDRATNRPRSLTDALADYRRVAAAHFKSLTDTEANGYPVAIALTINARDGEQLTDQRPLTLLLDIPPAMIEPPATTTPATTSPATATAPPAR